MADTGRQSPLGVNVLGSVLQNTGLRINPVAAKYMGSSKTNNSYTFGTLVNSTYLKWLTWAINDGYERGVPGGGTTLTVNTYNNLISIGAGVCEALGNSKPPTYVATDPAGIWARKTLTSSEVSTAEVYGAQTGYPNALPGPATSGYGNYDPNIPYGDSLQGHGVVDQKQNATWYPYTGDSSVNPNTGITKWGWVRCHALQAWNEFNWNGTTVNRETPEYKEFCASFMTMNGFVTNSNQTIHVIDNSQTFLDGVYSNMNDLISADIAGISLSSYDFGTDLANLGKVINLKKIETFGMPSNLLMNIGAAGAVTQDLSLALLASGLTKEEISSITTGVIPNWSKKLEQKIFGAFLIITGDNLAHILAPLQCRTQGLDTLADLLNVKKLFPTSYTSLTVPVYNSQLGLPTNSKTYYLLYQNSGINPALNSNEIKEYVGTIIPKGLPPTYNKTLSPNNFVKLPKGFNSYLDGIIPNEWATAAGAFSYAIRQIRNIENLNFEVLAKVATGIEGVTDLPLIAGTSKPTNQAATDDSKRICSLGSGQAGSYTMSDFFGCMSGLPYPWKLIYERIRQSQTLTLKNIYKELFLAVTWEPATVTPTYTTYQVETSPGVFTTYYKVTGLTIVDNGGGYGRGNAPAPTISISNGGTGTSTIGLIDTNVGSVGTGTYGRVTTVTLTSPGPDTTTVPTASIQCPPTSTSGGTNTASGTTGWGSPMNAVVQNYIDQANAEITSIKNTKTTVVRYLNEYWNILGKQLAKEQRARYTCSPPVPVSKDHFMNPYPVTSYSFLDSVPSLSQDTRPHMSAQTLEAISDMSNIGGQSMVGMMRQERNQARLAKLGIDPDNNIPNAMSPINYKTVLANGTVGGAIPGSGITAPTGEEYTLPAWPENENENGNEMSPSPSGFYVPADLANRILSAPNPGAITSPIPGTPGAPSTAGFQPTTATNEGDITPIIEGNPNPVVSTKVPAGPVNTPSSPIDNIVIIAPPAEYNPANLPPNIDPSYTNGVLLPASLTIPEAIEKVIECNCDCWVS